MLAVIAVVCAVGWSFELRPAAPVWGDIATWVSGLATSGGLVFAGVQIRDARRQRLKEDQRLVQAEVERRTAFAGR
ncbi:UNVERIFIED_ORG: hypothetical protein E4P37_08645 [Bacillus sp. AZ43]